MKMLIIYGSGLDANVGLCFDISNFADFSIISKLFLSIGMLLG